MKSQSDLFLFRFCCCPMKRSMIPMREMRTGRHRKTNPVKSIASNRKTMVKINVPKRMTIMRSFVLISPLYIAIASKSASSCPSCPNNSITVLPDTRIKSSKVFIFGNPMPSSHFASVFSETDKILASSLCVHPFSCRSLKMKFSFITIILPYRTNRMNIFKDK